MATLETAFLAKNDMPLKALLAAHFKASVEVYPFLDQAIEALECKTSEQRREIVALVAQDNIAWRGRLDRMPDEDGQADPDLVAECIENYFFNQRVEAVFVDCKDNFERGWRGLQHLKDRFFPRANPQLFVYMQSAALRQTAPAGLLTGHICWRKQTEGIRPIVIGHSP